MHDILLTTKLHRPTLRSNAIFRQRLMVKLNQAPHCKITLITAPAGFGKTTLIRQWLEGWDHPAGWLSLDEQDNHPARFLLYLLHAFHEIDPTLGNTALSLLQVAHQPQTSTILTHLINEGLDH